jgi:hypothetical protein
MRAQDGILRLSIPSAGLVEIERARPAPVPVLRARPAPVPVLRAGPVPVSAPRVRPVSVPAPRRSWLGRLLRRREPTAYHRCLAIHIHFAGPHSALY